MMPVSNPSFKLFFDESVSNRQLLRFEIYAENKGIHFSHYLNIKESHSGMPDTQIIHHLLSQHTILITNDRPFHNTMLSKGLRSFYVNDERVSEKSLAGIKVNADIPQYKKRWILKIATISLNLGC